MTPYRYRLTVLLRKIVAAPATSAARAVAATALLEHIEKHPPETFRARVLDLYQGSLLLQVLGLTEMGRAHDGEHWHHPDAVVSACEARAVDLAKKYRVPLVQAPE